MATITLNGVGCRMVTTEVAEWLRSVGEDPDSFNRLAWPAGASRWAEGRFLVDHEQAAQLLAYNLSDAITVELEDNRTENGTITADRMFQIGHRPIHFRSTSLALYEVTVVDERYFWQWKWFSDEVNVTLQSDRANYFDESENTGDGDPYTWGELVDLLTDALGVTSDTTKSLTVTSGAGDPQDYLGQYDNAAQMLDRVCANLGVCFVASWDATWSGSKRYKIAAPDAFDNTDATAVGNDLMAGGVQDNAPDNDEGKRWLNATMPAQARVLFPKENADGSDEETDSSSPTLNQLSSFTSTNGKPSGVDGRTGTEQVIHDNLWDTGTNSSDLQARADYLAARFYSRFQLPSAKSVWRGWHNDGRTVGTVTWAWHRDGPVTRYDVPSHWYGYGGDGNVGGGFLDKRVFGVGGVNVWKTYDGSLGLSADTTTVRDKIYVITGSTAQNSNPTTQFTYTGKEAEKATAGYGGWQAKAGATSRTLYNLAEEINSTSGVQGNGIDVANLDTDCPKDGYDDFEFQPIPDGAPVLVREVTEQYGDTTEYWIVGAGMPQGVDGTCCDE